MKINTIHTMDCLEGLRQMADGVVNTCVTSPPYFNLRDYNVAGQIGLEETPEIYIAKLVEIFREVKRVLRDDGTLWVNIGDSYARVGGTDKKASSTARAGNTKETLKRISNRKQNAPVGLKPKDLIGIPWMLAFALRADGWYLRQDIIWSKPNPMPESVTDRCTKAHEYIFLLSKSQKYYYDYQSIMKPAKEWTGKAAIFDRDGDVGKLILPGQSASQHRIRKSGNKERKNGSERGCPKNTGSNVCSSVPWEGLKANKRSVWTVTTKPFKEAHFATFPADLITDCIKAGCPVNGLALDPFMGAGTTAVVANRLERNFIGFELNADYVAIANKRLHNEFGLFNLAV